MAPKKAKRDIFLIPRQIWAIRTQHPDWDELLLDAGQMAVTIKKEFDLATTPSNQTLYGMGDRGLPHVQWGSGEVKTHHLFPKAQCLEYLRTHPEMITGYEAGVEAYQKGMERVMGGSKTEETESAILQGISRIELRIESMDRRLQTVETNSTELRADVDHLKHEWDGDAADVPIPGIKGGYVD